MLESHIERIEHAVHVVELCLGGLRILKPLDQLQICLAIQNLVQFVLVEELGESICDSFVLVELFLDYFGAQTINLLCYVALEVANFSSCLV